jgi:hypothetical protein
MVAGSLERRKAKPMQCQLGGRGGLMSEEVRNPVNIIIKYHLLFQYFQTNNQCPFNNNVNNSHRKEQTTTTTTPPTIINNNRILRGRRSLLTRLLCLMLNCIHHWFLEPFATEKPTSNP